MGDHHSQNPCSQDCGCGPCGEHETRAALLLPPSLSVSTPTQAMGFFALERAKAAPSHVCSPAHGCPEAGRQAAVLMLSCDSGPRQMIVKGEASVYNLLP